MFTMMFYDDFMFLIILWRLNANDVCMFTIYVQDDFIFMMILFLHTMILYFWWSYLSGDFMFRMIVLLCTMCIIVHLILCKNLPQVQHHSVQLLGSYEAEKNEKNFFSGFQIVTKWQMTAWMNAQTNEQTKEWLIKWMKNKRWNAVMNVLLYNVQKIIWISASKPSLWRLEQMQR